MGGDPFLSTYFNVLSILFPAGERLFVHSIEKFQYLIIDPQLKRDIKGFKAQEHSHTYIHNLFNENLKGRGYKIDEWEKKQQENYDFSYRVFGNKFMLAFTVCTEHLTSVFSEKWLSDHWDEYTPDEYAKRVWDWHTVEEIDHKAVAVDVYTAVGGTYFMRALAMVIVWVTFWIEMARRMIHFLRVDKQLYKWDTFNHILKFCFHPKIGIVSFVGGVLRFFSPSFHPSKVLNDSFMEKYDSQSS